MLIQLTVEKRAKIIPDTTVETTSLTNKNTMFTYILIKPQNSTSSKFTTYLH